jgi:hypothetical protein
MMPCKQAALRDKGDYIIEEKNRSKDCGIYYILANGDELDGLKSSEELPWRRALEPLT